MSRKKLSPLVQALALFNQLDERDRQTFAEFVRSQTTAPRKAATKKTKKETPLLTDVTNQTGSSAA